MSKLRDFFVNVVGTDEPSAEGEGGSTQAGLALGVLIDEADDRDGPIGDELVESVCHVFIVNKTDFPLRKSGERTNAGRFVKPPPETIPARQTRKASMIGTRQVWGALMYDLVGQGANWQMEFRFFFPHVGGQANASTTSFVSDRVRFAALEEPATAEKPEFRFMLLRQGPPPAPQSFITRVHVRSSSLK